MKTYKSKIFAAIHETAQNLHASGLMDAKTMREFDKSCLKPIKELTKKQLAELEALEAMPEEDINFTDIPEISDWSGFEVGKFYRAS